MTTLDDLKKSAADMSIDELIELSREVRKRRRELAQTRRAAAPRKKVNDKVDIKTLSKDQIISMLQKLEEEA